MINSKEKLLKIVVNKNPELLKKFEDRISKELEQMEKWNVLDDLLSLYYDIENDENEIGDKNDTNSLVAYAIGVTTKKPTKSFIKNNKRETYGRSGWPDIDMDFDCFYCEDILKYLREKYGENHVGPIGTVQTLKVRSAIRNAIRILDPEKDIVFNGKQMDIKANVRRQDEILESLPPAGMPMLKPDGSHVKSVSDAYNTYPAFAKFMDIYPEVYKAAKKLENSIHAMGQHPAGVILSPHPLSEVCPLHITSEGGSSPKKAIATQFTMNEVEDLGYIKFDILGVSTKSALSEAVRVIKKNHSIDIDLSKIPLDDKPTLDLLTKGDTIGCFQAERPGMQKTFKQIGIDSFKDIVISIAMYRPGPMDYIPELSERKKGNQKVSYYHPSMKEIAMDTWGILVFQEQIMQAFMVLARLSASDGYKFMKGCAKKKQHLIDAYEEQFYKGATRNGVSSNVIKRIWADLIKFSNYAFNASHSTAYALECWKTAYLKANFMIDFMVARLSVEAKRRKFDLVKQFEKDCLSHGIKIYDVDINRSKMEYIQVGEKAILRPLIVKGIGDKAAEEIIRCQPFEGKDLIYAFLSKVGNIVNARVIDALCDAKLFGKKPKEEVRQIYANIRKDQKKRPRPKIAFE